jgi:hypothetical protein
MAAILLAAHVQANDIELAISDELIDLKMTAEYEKDFSGSFAYMHADYEGIESDQLSYTFATQGKINKLGIMLGARAFLLDVEGNDGYGVALGAGGSLGLINKVSISGEVYYAPDIITGGDFDHTRDMSLRLNYQLIENGAVFIGYRNFEAEERSDVDVYDDPYLGIRFSF